MGPGRDDATMILRARCERAYEAWLDAGLTDRGAHAWCLLCERALAKATLNRPSRAHTLACLETLFGEYLPSE